MKQIRSVLRSWKKDWVIRRSSYRTSSYAASTVLAWNYFKVLLNYWIYTYTIFYLSCYRGLVTIEILKALEKQTGRRTYELFDYVCGVSTGAVLAILICLYKLPLDICEQLYKDFATQMFTRNKVLGTTKLVRTYGFYDSQSWEQLLR